VNRLARAVTARLPWCLLLPGLLAAGIGILVGCAANEPFHPESVPNEPPTVRLFVGPVDTNGTLNPTSYYRRTFRWSGTDTDGWVREFYVSVRTQAGVAAAWDTTTRTDTTMTFTPDDLGVAEATFLLVCRDDRGALSDTVRQFVPLRNFPPAVNFQSDFDPLRNLQRELLDADGQVTTNPTAAVDTVYWNWGPMNFRLFALDLDGAETMNEFYRYTLADGDGLPTRDEDDPLADPNECWVRVPFNSSAEIKQFTIFVKDVLPGPARTLRVSVKDEANSDANFSYTWTVREPKGPLLFLMDQLPPTARAYHETIFNSIYGAGNWDTYAFWLGMPDDTRVLLETFRKFTGLFWTDSGSGTLNIKAASSASGALTQYMAPVDGGTPGRLLFVSKGLVGQTNGLSNVFLQTVLGISPTASPAYLLYLPANKTAIHQSGTLPDLVTTRAQGTAGLGLALLPAVSSDPLYRLESCTCYADPRRPADVAVAPIVGMRTPARATAALAKAVALSVQLDVFNNTQVTAALRSILLDELGVVAP
jgi:hypothetical protein